MTFLNKKYPSSFITDNELRKILMEVGEPVIFLVTTKRQQLIKRIDELKDKIVGTYLSEKQLQFLKRKKIDDDEKINEYYTFEDMKIIENYFSEPEHQKSKIKLNQYNLIRAFYGAGFRVREICDFDANNIDEMDSKIRILGKGAKWRWTHVEPDFIRFLIYMKGERKVIVKTKNSYGLDYEPLFLNRDNKPYKKRDIQKFMKTLSHKIKGLSYHMHPHLLRHTYAVHRILNNPSLNIEVLRQDMGHINVNTTQIYFRLADRERKFLSHHKGKQINNEKIEEESIHAEAFFCKACGKRLDKDSVFCRYCGIKQ